MKYLNLTLIFTLLAYVSWAQPQLVDTERFSFEPDISYHSAIPSPKEFLGYELGNELTVYAKVEYYYKALSEASPRVIYNEYGKTYEGRPLINLVISSEDNIQNIDQIREEHLRLLTASRSEATPIINNQPVFTSMSYNIHGNEASSTEAAMQVAYRLAAAEDEETKEVLKNSVIIMYICINPDGRDRFVSFHKSMKRLKRPGAESNDLEHMENWPGGRTNHYWFDLNRDWIWGVHPESRGHTAEYQKWMPQVHVDYHEQGANSNYFTMPGTTPRNKLLPNSYENWSKVFGDANIAEFDKHQINYFTRDAFDFFYPGYGSSYPSVLGAIGMLTEQGSARGRITETEDGNPLTLRQGIWDHYTTSIATIKTAAEKKSELLQYSYDSWQPTNSKTNTKAYFFSSEDLYSGDLLAVLLRNQVKVYEAQGSFRLNTARDFRTGQTSRVDLPRGTYIVPMDQPRNLFIASIMERNMSIEDSVMYDMATWSAPLAYNIDAWSTTGSYSVQQQEITSVPESTGEVVNENARYAYVISWNQRFAHKALAKLWAKKYNVRSATKSFGNSDFQFPAGSLVILVGRNREKADEIHQDMKTIANQAGVKIVGFNSGRMVNGYDLASTRNRPVQQPRIAMLVESPFSSYTAGQIFYLFDWETELPIERVRLSALQQGNVPGGFGRVDLKDYDVLILPGGRNFNDLFGEKGLEEIKNWVSEGGTLVATEGAASFFTKKMSGFTGVELKEAPKDSSRAIAYLKYEDRETYFGKKRIPGTAMNATIDITHPLAFGMKKDLYALKFGNTGLVPSNSLQTVGYYSENISNLSVAGYASSENLNHLAGSSFAGVATLGRGKIVFLVDNTQYRMFWIGPSRMMINAVMLLPGF